MPRPFVALLGLCLAVVLLAGCGGGKPSEEVTLGGIYLTEVLDGLLTRAVRTVSTIDSMAAADAAAPELRRINEDFYDLRYHAPKLSDAGQEELAQHARKQYRELRNLVDAVGATPPLAKRLGGEMDVMMKHLEALMAPPFKDPGD